MYVMVSPSSQGVKAVFIVVRASWRASDASRWSAIKARRAMRDNSLPGGNKKRREWIVGVDLLGGVIAYVVTLCC